MNRAESEGKMDDEKRVKPLLPYMGLCAKLGEARGQPRMPKECQRADIPGFAGMEAKYLKACYEVNPNHPDVLSALEREDAQVADEQ